jgi:hypothetical protein
MHRAGVAKDHLIESTWFLRGLRGSDIYAGAPTRTREECRLFGTSAKNWRSLLTLALQFRIYFEHFSLCICLASICINELGLFFSSICLLLVVG